MQFIQDHWTAIVAALLAISELLALIPSVKANSIFQLLLNVLKSAQVKAVEPKAEEKK